MKLLEGDAEILGAIERKMAELLANNEALRQDAFSLCNKKRKLFFQRNRIKKEFLEFESRFQKAMRNLLSEGILSKPFPYPEQQEFFMGVRRKRLKHFKRVHNFYFYVAKRIVGNLDKAISV